MCILLESFNNPLGIEVLGSTQEKCRWEAGCRHSWTQDSDQGRQVWLSVSLFLPLLFAAQLHRCSVCSKYVYPWCFATYKHLLFSRWVGSDSLWPQGLQHARLPCPSLSLPHKQLCRHILEGPKQPHVVTVHSWTNHSTIGLVEATSFLVVCWSPP